MPEWLHRGYKQHPAPPGQLRNTNYSIFTGEDRVLLLKTILNRIQKFPSHVYKDARLLGQGDQQCLEIDIVPRKNGRCLCSGCLRPAPGYDVLAPRRFQFIPLWNIPVFFVYSMRRVQCRRCQRILVEAVPWAEGKQRTTHAFSLEDADVPF